MSLSRPACAGVSLSASNRSAKRAAACAPTCASKNAGDVVPRGWTTSVEAAVLEPRLRGIVQDSNIMK
jgi:hypothetical protein